MGQPRPGQAGPGRDALWFTADNPSKNRGQEQPFKIFNIFLRKKTHSYVKHNRSGQFRPGQAQPNRPEKFRPGLQAFQAPPRAGRAHCNHCIEVKRKRRRWCVIEAFDEAPRGRRNLGLVMQLILGKRFQSREHYFGGVIRYESFVSGSDPSGNCCRVCSCSVSSPVSSWYGRLKNCSSHEKPGKHDA
jgi:hypothetical protein